MKTSLPAFQIAQSATDSHVIRIYDPNGNHLTKSQHEAVVNFLNSMKTVNPAMAAAGRLLTQQVISILKQNGDTTARQLIGGKLLGSPEAILEPLVEAGYIECIGQHYRLTQEGREL